MSAFSIIFNQIKDLKAKNKNAENYNIASLEKTKREIEEMMKTHTVIETVDGRAVKTALSEKEAQTLYDKLKKAGAEVIIYEEKQDV